MRLGHGRSSKRPKRGARGDSWERGAARVVVACVRREQLGKEKKLTGGPRMSAAREREEGGGDAGGLVGPSRPKREGERREGWISFFYF